jgi:methyl-accepting chemotaxis protein
MHVTRPHPLPQAAEAAPALTSNIAGQAPPSAVPVSGDVHYVPSQHIVDIIGVIDEIALQTCTLARTAAIEAARTGPDREFAKVATEVKNLAQRSTAAVKEIRGMIGESVSKARQADEDLQREFSERAKRWRNSLAA